MIQLTPQMRVLLAIEPADFRLGIDGLCALCRLRLNADPFSGTVFAFRNRTRTAVKLLVFDGTGYWLCHKRFSQQKLCWWPTSTQDAVHPLAAQHLAVLLYAGDPRLAAFSPDWRKVS